MHDDTDTKIIERKKYNPTPPKPTGDNGIFMLYGGLCGLLLSIVVFVVVHACTITKDTGVLKMTPHDTVAVARELVEPPKLVKPTPKFNHVIFSQGKTEIFRFTYEDGGEGLHYSFEVREGSL